MEAGRRKRPAETEINPHVITKSSELIQKYLFLFFSLYIIYRQEKVFLKEKLPCSQLSQVSMTVSLLITAVLPFQVVRQQSQMLVYLIVTHEYHERLVEILDHNRFLHQDRIHDEVYLYDRRYQLSLHV